VRAIERRGVSARTEQLLRQAAAVGLEYVANGIGADKIKE
jgi:hypothetical protein